jgi:hypothetical protein
MNAADFLFSRVEDHFELAGRGCVIVPGVEPSTLQGRTVRRGAALRLLRPDGSVLSTRIHDLEFLDGPNLRSCVPIVLPPGTSKSDVPIGTEVWLCSPSDTRTA